MKISANEIIHLIQEHNDWIEANNIAEFFDVSTRTIRKHIKNINETYPGLIVSSYKGYKINTSEYADEISESDDELNTRANYIIRKLITTTKPISIYDLADELYISDSSLERALRVVKNILETFELSILRKRNRIQIDGKERRKRKLINYLISKENQDGGFSDSNFNTHFITNDIDPQLIENKLHNIFNNRNLYINDYGFNTIMFHIIIMLERVLKGEYVAEDNIISDAFSNQTISDNVMEDIKMFIEKQYHVTLPDIELYYLTIVVSNNCNFFEAQDINKSNIDSFIEPEYIEFVKKVAKDLEANYCLEKFSDDFLVNLTIHIRNLIVRVKNETHTHNPLTQKFQTQYPLIFDMAAFIVKELNTYLNVKIVDDEIAFIAFHIGSYLESNKIIKDKINVCYVYADYHNFHLNNISKINDAFDSEIYISAVISVKEFNQTNNAYDLIICPELLDTSLPVVSIGIFIDNKDIERIRDAIDKIKINRKKDKLRKDLNHFIGENLFKKEYYCEDNIEMIRELSKECISLGLCDTSFTNEVIERELLTPTSFKNGIAIPHSLRATCKHSFMAIVLNKKKMLWGRNFINIVILMGTSTTDRERFKNVYDELVQILYEPSNIRVLTKCNNYDEFITKLVNLIS